MTAGGPLVLVLSCEHGVNRIPARYADRFRSAAARAALDGHRGRDIGALPAARALARWFRVPLVTAPASRLLVETNRSPHNPAVFSEFVKTLDRGERERILRLYYTPHRERVEAAIRRAAGAGKGKRKGKVLHVAVHSFTPRLRGVTRNADIALLYDPTHSGEPSFCASWRRALLAADPGLRVRRNYPYRGRDDGLTRDLRRRFGPKYLGVELEMNQALLGTDARRLIRAAARSLAEAIRPRLPNKERGKPCGLPLEFRFPPGELKAP